MFEMERESNGRPQSSLYSCKADRLGRVRGEGCGSLGWVEADFPTSRSRQVRWLCVCTRFWILVWVWTWMMKPGDSSRFKTSPTLKLAFVSWSSTNSLILILVLISILHSALIPILFLILMLKLILSCAWLWSEIGAWPWLWRSLELCSLFLLLTPGTSHSSVGQESLTQHTYTQPILMWDSVVFTKSLPIWVFQYWPIAKLNSSPKSKVESEIHVWTL